jgi:hypothetical protein
MLLSMLLSTLTEPRDAADEPQIAGVRSQEAQSQSRMRRGRLVVQCSLAVQPFDHVEWSV